MLSLKSVRYFLIPTIFLLIVLNQSCDNIEEGFYLGSDFVESKSHIVVTDTFASELSTVMLDSFATSGTETVLYGVYSDTVFGKVISRSFFRLQYPSLLNIEEGDVYDSTVLILNYNGYSYGDTTVPQTINVHRLTAPIKLNEDDYCYNKTNVSFDVVPLGHKTYIPYPKSMDSVIVMIDDNFGLDLWQQGMENTNIYSSQEAFLDYLPGLAIASDENSQSAVIGFEASINKIILRIYSHRIGENITQIHNDFKLSDTEYQFNHIESDFSGTPLSIIPSQNEDVASYLTGNRAYIQGGTGLFAKIRFPYLQDFLLIENVKLLKAEIIIHPDLYSYIDNSLPDSLILQLLDQHNRILGAFYNSEGDLVTADFSYDEFYHEDSYYVYDITSYLESDFSDKHVDTEKSLAVSIHPDHLYTTFQRLILEKGKAYPKLRIYYVSY